MRISDWSSDVCSSDLAHILAVAVYLCHRLGQRHVLEQQSSPRPRHCLGGIGSGLVKGDCTGSPPTTLATRHRGRPLVSGPPPANAPSPHPDVRAPGHLPALEAAPPPPPSTSDPPHPPPPSPPPLPPPHQHPTHPHP